MKRVLYVLPALAMAALAPYARAAHTHVPTPSTWELNVSASDFGGGPAMKSDRMTILTDTDKWFKWTDVSVDADGKTWKTSWSGPQDGTLKPIVGMQGGQASFKTDDDSSHWVMPDGSTSDSIMVLSPDKKKGTLTMTIKTKDGKEFHQTLVYDRVK
ncbi:MAG TPA: hypothetical protein VFA99_07855 [Acidobacteriaceae bacterium]|nr:hypothetical protein [Acidobacteriaceae bacterium]